MSFREKSAWTCLATTIGVFIPYFVYVMRSYQDGGLTTSGVSGVFILIVVIQTILTAAAHVAFSISSRPERRDERDVAIELKSFQYSYHFLMVCLFSLVGFVMFASRSWLDGAVTMLAFSQLVLLLFVLAEIVKYLTRAISYRRGS